MRTALGTGYSSFGCPVTGKRPFPDPLEVKCRSDEMRHSLSDDEYWVPGGPRALVGTALRPSNGLATPLVLLWLARMRLLTKLPPEGVWRASRGVHRAA